MKPHFFRAFLILGALAWTGLPLAFSEEADYARTAAFLRRQDREEIEERKTFRSLHREGIDRVFADRSPEMRALLYALTYRDFETADALKSRVDLRQKDGRGQNIFLTQSMDGKRAGEWIRWIVENGIDIDCMRYKWHRGSRQPDGSWKETEVWETFVEYVTFNLDILKTIMYLRPELVDKRNPETGRTPLHAAATDAKYELQSTEVLLTYGADIEATDKQGWTPLIQAVVHSQYDNALLLLSYGANPDIPFRDLVYLPDKDNPEYVQYDNVLDYLYRSQRSLGEGPLPGKNERPDDTTTLRAAVNRNAKKALVALLKKLLDLRENVDLLTSTRSSRLSDFCGSVGMSPGKSEADLVDRISKDTNH